jgi:hypothetical protein
MNKSPLGPADDSTPDFSWPERIIERFVEWLSGQWENLLDHLETGLFERRLPRLVLRVVLWSCVAYIGLVWLCLCYIRFPVGPYGLWEVVKWVAIVIAVTFGAIYTLYAGGAAIALFLSLLLSIVVYFTFSLAYLCWVLPGAVRKRSPWLQRYGPVMVTGLIASLALATFVDGAYRFWDEPFDVAHWATLVFISSSAWATLFCGLVRDRAMQRATPRVVLKWTVGLTIGIGLFAFWEAGSKKSEYFLRKNVVQHPKDVSAWLDLASHYYNEGEKLAADSGDEDHAPPDPAPSYREALDCLDQAVSLGATGFEVQFARAQLADELGERQKAMFLGQDAVNLAPPLSDVSDTKETDRVKWLRDMIARNAAAPLASDVEENRQERVRDQRRDELPGIVRWVFKLL